MQKPFSKRLYPNLGEFFHDIRFILKQRSTVRTLMQEQVIDSAFRERLMLTVTQVNDCRYCNYYHSRLALASGISQEEISAIAGQSVINSPPEEQPALLYAQHWAESGAQPDPEIRRGFLAQYGEETGKMIELSLRMIRVGNLTGNFLDYLLDKLFFWRY